MPQCSFKSCKNHTSRTLKKDGVSYFRFPRNPEQCEKWISIIAKQRSDEFFRPTQASVICSKHFSEKDEYITTKGVKRLRKTAVPRIDLIADIEDKSCLKQRSRKPCKLNPPVNIKIEVLEAPENPVLTSSSILDIRRKNNLMIKKLITCKNIVTMKNKRISALREQNCKLKQRNSNLKKLISILRKDQEVDQSILHNLSTEVDGD